MKLHIMHMRDIDGRIWYMIHEAHEAPGAATREALTLGPVMWDVLSRGDVATLDTEIKRYRRIGSEFSGQTFYEEIRR